MSGHSHPSTGVENLFSTLQVGWEYVATPSFSALCMAGRFVKTSPLIAVPLYTALALVITIAWLFFGWIFSALWTLLWSFIKLVWYSPLLYAFWRFFSITGRRLLRRLGQDKRADTLANTMKQVVNEWVALLWKKLLSRLLGIGGGDIITTPTVSGGV